MNQFVNALSLPTLVQPLVTPRLVLADLRRQAWLVLSLAVVGFLAGALLALVHTPRFLAEARLIVENIHLDASRQEMVPTSAFVDSSLVDSQVEILKAPSLMLRTIDDLKLREDPDYARLSAPSESRIRAFLTYLFPLLDSATLAGRDRANATLVQLLQEQLTVRRIGQSTVVTVGFIDQSPDQAAAIVNSLVKAYLNDQSASAASYSSSVSAWLRDRVKDLGPRARVVSWALSPSQRQGPKAGILVAACSFAAAALGILIALLRSGLNGALRHPAQASLVLPGAFLGSFPQSRGIRLTRVARRGSTDPAPSSHNRVPLTSLLYRNSDRCLRAAVAAAMRGPSRPTVIGVTSTDAGDGVTTIAIHLAAAAARAGLRVLLVDGNALQPTLTRALGVEDELGLADLLRGEQNFPDFCRPTDIGGVELMFVGRQAGAISPHIRGERLGPVCRAFREVYDLTIVDLPSVTSSLEVSFSLKAVDVLLHVVAWNKTDGAATEREIGLAGAEDKYLGFVFNRHRGRA